MEDGIGEFLGLEPGEMLCVREAMRPMLLQLMQKMKRELKTELTAQLRRDLRLLMKQYRQGEATTTGSLVPAATRVADEKGYVDARSPEVRRQKPRVNVPDEERDWFDAVRKFNKAE